MTKKEPSVDIYEFEDLTVIVPEDPVWDPALEALQNLGDPRAIACLLKSQVPIPAYIGRSLGIMLDPPAGYEGVRLRSSGKAGVAERVNAINKIVERKKRQKSSALCRETGKSKLALPLLRKNLG